MGGPGLPLGVMEEAAYKEMSRSIRPGQVVVVGTDGIWEARNPENRLFGKDRFKQLIAARAGHSAAELADHIMASVRDFTGPRPREDDVTIVVFKLTG